jgi:hypothetical protein
MQVRPYNEGDLAALKKIHATQGFSYPFPDLQNPLFLTKLVLADEQPVVQAFRPEGFCIDDQGKGIVGAALLRLTAEAYLLLDPQKGTPRQRWEWLLALHSAANREAWQRGLEDVHAWLPPEIAATFGKRLTHLGWLRDDAWTPYCKRLREGTTSVVPSGK